MLHGGMLLCTGMSATMQILIHACHWQPVDSSMHSTCQQTSRTRCGKGMQHTCRIQANPRDKNYGCQHSRHQHVRQHNQEEREGVREQSNVTALPLSLVHLPEAQGSAQLQTHSAMAGHGAWKACGCNSGKIQAQLLQNAGICWSAHRSTARQQASSQQPCCRTAALPA